jgi:hypothetical protein
VFILHDGMTPKEDHSMTRTSMLAALAIAGLAGCAATEPLDPFAAATPDVAGLVLETTGDAADGLAAPAARSMASLAATCQPYEYLCNVQAAVSHLNGFVRMVLKPVEALVAAGGAEVSPHLKVYGPLDLPAGDGAAPVGTFRLTVFHVGGLSSGSGGGTGAIEPGLYRWKLEARGIRTPDAPFQVIMAGGLKRGEKAHRGRGTIGIDIDAAAAALGSDVVRGSGKLLASFAHVGGHKSLAYVLEDFRATADSELVPFGVLVGHKNEGGPARVRIASLAEWVAPPPADPAAADPAAPDAGLELLVSRAAWFPDVGGRAAVVVAGGDVPAWSERVGPVDYFLGVSCYDKEKNEVYRDLFACVRPSGFPGGMSQGGRSCQPVPDAWLPDPGFRTGVPSLCRLPGDDLCDDGNPPPDVSPTSPEPEPGAPATPDVPPLSMPDHAF